MSWLYLMLTRILQKLDEVLADVNPQGVSLGTRLEQVQSQLQDLANVVGSLQTTVGQLEQQMTSVLQTVATLLQEITPPTPVVFKLQFTEGSAEMAKVASGKLKFNILDNGTATATLTPVDAAGVAVPWPSDASAITWTSSNPAVVVTPSTTNNLQAAVAPASPPTLATGVVITAQGTLADGTVVKGDNSADPINVVAGPAGSFVIALSTP
jgi:hypothetical protein